MRTCEKRHMRGFYSKLLKDTWAAIKEARFKLTIPLAADILFFTAFSGALVYFQYTLGELLYNLQGFLSSDLDLSGELMSQSDIGKVLSQQVQFKAITAQMIQHTIIFFAMVYVAYVIFESISWYFSIRTIKKQKFWPYVGQFAYVNLFWILIIGAIVFAGIKVALFNSMSMYPILSTKSGAMIIAIAALLVGYFMVVSYGLIGQHEWKTVLLETFRLGFRKIHVFLVVFGASLVVFMLINKLMRWPNSFNGIMLLGVFVFLPAVILFRILNLVLVKNLKKEEK